MFTKAQKEIILCTIMTATMLSVIGFAVTLFMGAFFVKAVGFTGVLSLLAIFGAMAVVGNIVSNKMESA